MRIFHITWRSASGAELELAPQALPARGFVWMSCSGRREFEAAWHADPWLQRWGGRWWTCTSRTC